MLYRMIEMPSDQRIQYVGVHVLRWGKASQPTHGFVEIDELGQMLDEAIGLYLEFKDVHDYEPKRARAAAVVEIMEGINALEDIAEYEAEERQAAMTE